MMTSLQNLDLPPMALYQLGAAFVVVVLLVILIASFMSRSRVFCQYLNHMTGIELSPGAVRRIYKAMGRRGVRDHLIDLLIQEDLADTSRVVTPDSKPDLSIFDRKK
jgi:glycosylphosphatidylinositol transamidase (GPIT) subunit GPI8